MLFVPSIIFLAKFTEKIGAKRIIQDKGGQI